MAETHRRDGPRSEIVLKVNYRSPQALVEDYATNVGKGGLFIRTDASFEVGHELDLTLCFPGLDDVDVQGVVRWVSPGGADRVPGVGVEFLRAADHPDARIRELMQAGAQRHSATHARPFRVLLVEDNELVRDLFTFAVKRFHRRVHPKRSLEVLEAGTSREVDTLVAAGSIDCAIIDQFLPGLPGHSVIASLRAMPRYADLPIIAVSVGGRGIREAALAAGANVYLDKPVLASQLVSTLGRLVLAAEAAKVAAG